MRNYWSRHPAFRLLFPFLAGVILFILQPGLEIFMGVALLLCVVFMCWMVLAKQFWLHGSSKLLSGVAPVMAVMAAAYLLTLGNTEIYAAKHFSKVAKRDDVLMVMIAKPPVQKANSVRIIGKVLEVRGEDNRLPAKGKLLLTFLKDSLSQSLTYGDVIAVHANFSIIESPKNPEQFNYAEYMSFQNVWHQTFVNAASWKFLASGYGNPMMVWVYALREHLMNQLKRFVKTPDELAVAGALMLGYRDYLTPEVVQSYAAAGALHVLCVSGLHVGMVFVVLNSMLFFLNKKRSHRIIQSITIIIFIWLYACLTGLSPSVLRAATMFSMMAAGKLFSQRPNIVNIICASAILLMLFDPYIMTEVGFKLSYFAVLGIVFLQPIVYSWVVFKDKILDWFWKISAVSVAAQAATFPLGLLYFHQFPNFFLASNLVVIPSSQILIYNGLATFIAEWFFPIQQFLGKLFHYLLFVLNQAIFRLESIPYSITQSISISGVEAIAVYGLVVLFFLMLLEFRFDYLMVALSILLSLTVWNSYESLIQQRQYGMFVYAVKNSRAVAVVMGNKIYRDFDERLLANESSMLFHVKHHWWKMNVKQELPMDSLLGFAAFDEGYAFMLGSQKVLVVDKPFHADDLALPSNVDWVLLSGNPKVKLAETIAWAKPKTIIADCSNKTYRKSNWRKDAQNAGMEFYDVDEKGAFILEL